MTIWLDCLEHNTRYRKPRGCSQCKNKEEIVKQLEGRLVGLANGEIRKVKDGLIELTIDGRKRIFRMNSYQTIYLEAFLASAEKLEREAALKTNHNPP